jgi:hypothetical protein
MGLLMQDIIFGRTKGIPLVFTIDTRLGNGNNTITIPLQSFSNNFSIDFGDGITQSIFGNSINYTYAVGGVYTIKIKGIFFGFRFNNISDAQKLVSIVDWGSITSYSTNQSRAFMGCTNLVSLGINSLWFNTIINGSSMFQGTKISSLENGITFSELENGNTMFAETTILEFPNTVTFSKLIDGGSMFAISSITSLPISVTFNILQLANNMFQNSKIISLPLVTFSKVTNGNGMFIDSIITTLPNTVTFNDLSFSGNMFLRSRLSALPQLVTLNNVIIGSGMFQNSLFTSFENSQISLTKLTNGNFMFFGSVLNTISYSNLLINTEIYSIINNVTLFMGDSKFNSGGQIARNKLLARGWNITDGGLQT